MDHLSDNPTRFLQETLIDLRDSWSVLSRSERVKAFEESSRSEADDFFLSLGPHDQAELLFDLPPGERRIWIRIALSL